MVTYSYLFGIMYFIDFFGLAPNKEVKLKYAYNITCTSVVERDETTNEILKLTATVAYMY